MRDNETVAILAGIGIGAALMFFLDPHRGNGRRVPAIESPVEPTLRSVRDLEASSEETQNDAPALQLVEAEMR